MAENPAKSKSFAEKANSSPTYKDASGQIVYYKAEVDRSYVGGIDGITEYLRKNRKYPSETRDNGVEGTVFVDFVINKNGKIPPKE